MTQTPNYKLTQWAKTDRIQMEPFNEDNAKIDAALKAHDTAIAAKAAQSDLTKETSARTKAISALNTAIAKLGNCQLYTTTYVGTGTLSAEQPKVLTFPKAPKLVYVAAPRTYHLIAAPGVTYYEGGTVYERYDIAWSGKTMSWSGGRTVAEGMNAQGVTYQVVALLDAGT